MDINPEELIESVRGRIEKKTKLEAHKLIFNGVTLADDETLSSYKVKAGAVITVQSQYYGQYMPMGVTPAMENQAKRSAEDADLDLDEPEAKKVPVITAEDITSAKIESINARAATYGEK